MKVLPAFLLTFLASSAMTVHGFGFTYELPDDDSWFVPDSDHNFTWVTKQTVKKELNSLIGKPKLIRYHLFTRSNPEKAQILEKGATDMLANSYFNSSDPTSVIIHGWKCSVKTFPCTILRSPLLEREPTNVICVDWSEIAKKAYPTARFAVPSVGKDTGEFINFLRSAGGLSYDKLTLIGHSLGGHTVGFAGKNLNSEAHHIIGLDAALPLFSYKDCSARLCETDAEFVESIHTCGFRLGMFEPLGAAAYYPNGGKIQPKCDNDTIGWCSHKRAVVYLAEAITLDNFEGKQCSHTGSELAQCGAVDKRFKLGSPNSYGIKGVFFVPINDESPYGTG